MLAALAGRTNGHIRGHVFVNGKPKDASFMNGVGYVEQDDQLMGILSVRENLMFSAQLRLPTTLTFNEKKTRVEDAVRSRFLSN